MGYAAPRYATPFVTGYGYVTNDTLGLGTSYVPLGYGYES